MHIEDVATNIMIARERRGISRKELAERAGIDIKSLKLIEDGAVSFTIDTILAIAAGLGISPTVFFGGKDNGRCVSRQEVCNNVCAAREKRGITQKQLCDRCGANILTLKLIEQNQRNSRVDKLLTIAGGIGCSPAEFFAPSKTAVVTLTHCGVTHTIGEWAEICGIRARTIQDRLRRGDTTEQALRPAAKNPTASKQPCWTCRKACGRCLWSRKPNPQPIPGWIASPTTLTVTGGAKCSSYHIRFCPEYEYDGSNEREVY